MQLYGNCVKKKSPEKSPDCFFLFFSQQNVNMNLVQRIVEKMNVVQFLSGDPKVIMASLPSLHVIDSKNNFNPFK